MPAKDHVIALVESGKATRFGPPVTRATVPSENPSRYALPESCNYRAKQVSIARWPFNRSQDTGG